jgi:hypothetical protein
MPPRDKESRWSEKAGKPRKTRPFELRHYCMICGQPGPETICERCKIAVQAEAVARQQKILKEGEPT